MDKRSLRDCFGKFSTGVTVVTWFDEEMQKGITVNSFTSVSLDPPLALISINKSAKSYSGLKGKSFSINILASDQEAVAWQFAGRRQESIKLNWDNSGIAPKINGSAAWLECDQWKEYDAGDHVLFVGEIKQFHYRDADSLTFYQGKMGSTKNL